MEVLKQYKFSETQMRELHAQMSKMQETTKLLEGFIKSQEGTKYSREEAEETLSLLGNNLNALNREVEMMSNQVENWNKALDSPNTESQTIREFLKAINDEYSYANFAARVSWAKSQGKIQSTSGNGGVKDPFKFSVKDLKNVYKKESVKK